MTYEIECGHCGYQFTLDGSPLARSVKCPVCGGVLTVAVAVPKTPEPPPTAPPPSSPPSVPVAKPAKRLPTEFDPADRASKLAEPWRTIRKGLNTARTATDFALAPYIGLLTVGLAVSPLMPTGDQRGAMRLLALLALAHLLPAAIHIAGQITCVFVPRTHGAPFASGSLWLLGLALFLLLTFDSPRGNGLVVVVCVVLLLVSIVLWLTFLSRLADRLSDRAFKAELKSFGAWFWRGLGLSLMLLCIAYFAEDARSKAFAWIGFAGAGAIGFLLLCGYSALLRVATQALDRHSPLASGS